MQLEILHKYGMDNPITGLHEKTLGYQFSEKVEVRDPYTKKLDKKPMKPFMVNNSVIVFEKNKIMLNPYDALVIEQLSQYKVKSISSTGLPTYTDENEHIVDCINLALLVFEQKYGDMLKKIVSSKMLPINGLKVIDNVKPRDKVTEPSFAMVSLGKNNGYLKKDMSSTKSFRSGASQSFTGRRGF